jgi:hypothetical protein
LHYERPNRSEKIMSRFKFGIAVVVLATALSSAAYAAKGGGGGSGAHFGGSGAGHITARPAISRSTASPISP